MYQMLISVIVPCYNRKKFLLYALESLYNQTLSKDRFEVIVEKNFEDEKIDKLINDYGFKNIYSKDTTLAGKVIEGVKLANGDIITFLEDDDLYRNNRLERVYEEFKKDNDLIYLHNSQAFIDSNGNLIPENNSLVQRIIKTQPYTDVEINPLDCKLLEYLLLKTKNIGFNISSTAVKKEILINNIKHFYRLNLILDFSIFLFSLLSSKKLKHIAEKLTLYRIHEQNVSAFTSSNVSFEEYLKRRQNIIKERYIPWKYLYENFSNKFHCSACKKRIILEYLNYKFKYVIFSKREEIKINIKIREIYIFILLNKANLNSLIIPILLFIPDNIKYKALEMIYLKYKTM